MIDIEKEALKGQIDELYTFRLLYNAYLFNLWHEQEKYPVFKSKKHDDGTIPYEGEYFIVYAVLPTGQISNHYPIDTWDFFKIPEKEKMHIPFDNHTSQDVLERLWNNLEIEIYGKIQ